MSHSAGAQAPTAGVIVSVDDSVDPVFPAADSSYVNEVEYLLEVSNFTREPATNLVVEADTPEGTFFGEASTTLGRIEAPPQGQPGRMRVLVDSLGAGGVVRIRFELGLTAPAGSRIDFRATVASDGSDTVEVEEPTFVVSRGDAVLRWEPLPIRGGANTAPRGARVERPEQPLVVPSRPPLDLAIEGLEYRVYRSVDPDVRPGEDELFTTLPATQRSTGALPSGFFYAVTVAYLGQESAASNAVSLGRGEPTIEDVRIRGGRLVANGSGFEPGVTVSVDGVAFRAPAKVKRGGARVQQEGRLETGQSLARFMGPGREVTVCFTNPGGGTSCTIAGGFTTVP